MSVAEPVPVRPFSKRQIRDSIALADHMTKVFKRLPIDLALIIARYVVLCGTCSERLHLRLVRLELTSISSLSVECTEHEFDVRSSSPALMYRCLNGADLTDPGHAQVTFVDTVYSDRDGPSGASGPGAALS